MSDFEITVNGTNYKGELQAFGYSYKIVITINDIPVIFEPDEERCFRAIVPPEHLSKIDARQLKAIAEEIEAVLK